MARSNVGRKVAGKKTKRFGKLIDPKIAEATLAKIAAKRAEMGIASDVVRYIPLADEAPAE